MPQNIPTTGLGVFVLIALAIFILFYLTLYRTLNLVKPENRKINPLSVWLLFIPVFKSIWIFVVVTGISKSIKEELISRDYDVSDKPAFVSGICYAVALCFDLLIFVKIPESWFWALAGVGALQIIFFIQYWSKVNWYKNILKNDNLKEAQ